MKKGKQESIRFSPLGDLIQKTARAGSVRKGAETARVPEGRVEATRSQNYLHAKVMRKQKL